jgi:hypothetical protein
LYRRDTQPAADLKTIGFGMAREQYALAEPALRECLRRATHDGEARTVLEKGLAARGDVRGCALQQNSQATLESGRAKAGDVFLTPLSPFASW